MRTLGRTLLAWLVGALLCTRPLLSVYAAGWTYRWSARVAARRWQALAGGDVDPPWPRWRDLRANVGTGARVLLNTWMFTGPWCLLMAIGWRWGWDASFSKTATAAHGPGLVLVGMVGLAAAMAVLPVAQVRHATTGDWRAFWDLGLVLRLVRQRWAGWIALSAAYAALAVPLFVFVVGPVVASDAVTSDAEAVAWLRRWSLAWALVLFPAYALLRGGAARLYATGLVAALREGTVSPSDLHPLEREALSALALLPTAPLPSTRTLRFARRTVRLAATALVVTGLALSNIEIVAGAFFHYRPTTSWWTHPMIHTPTFSLQP